MSTLNNTVMWEEPMSTPSPLPSCPAAGTPPQHLLSPVGGLSFLVCGFPFLSEVLRLVFKARLLLLSTFPPNYSEYIIERIGFQNLKPQNIHQLPSQGHRHFPFLQGISGFVFYDMHSQPGGRAFLRSRLALHLCCPERSLIPRPSSSESITQLPGCQFLRGNTNFQNLRALDCTWGAPYEDSFPEFPTMPCKVYSGSFITRL